MKQKGFMMLLCAFLALAGNAFGADVLKVQNVTLRPSTSVELAIELQNQVTNYMGWQCDITLAQELTLELNKKGKPVANRGERLEDTDHSISSSLLSSGAYRFVATSMGGEEIPETQGTLFSVVLIADASLQPGSTCQGKISNIEFNTTDNKRVLLGDVTFSITVQSKSEPVTITARSYSRQYGAVNPTFGYTTQGAELVGTPTITCTASATSPVGTYPITVSKGSVSNEDVTYVNGTLTITKAPLTVSAGNYTMKQGEALPQFTPTFSGFKNGEDSSVLTKQPTLSCSATASSAPGDYDITVSGAEAQNYSISYVKGKLNIKPKEEEPGESIEITDISKLENAIYVEPFAARTGDETNIEIKLKNAGSATSYGFELVLPEGIDIETDNDGSFDEAVTLSTRNSKHTATTNRLANGNYKIAVASLGSKALTDNDGLVLTVKAHVSETMAVGDYAVKIENPLLVLTDGTKPAIVGTTTKVTIEDYIKGDVDGDRVVDLADAVLIINYYVGKTVEKFVEKAAYVDDDNVIDLADAVKIINFYVGKIPSLARKKSATEHDPQ